MIEGLPIGVITGNRDYWFILRKEMADGTTKNGSKLYLGVK